MSKATTAKTGKKSATLWAVRGLVGAHESGVHLYVEKPERKAETYTEIVRYYDAFGDYDPKYKEHTRKFWPRKVAFTMCAAGFARATGIKLPKNVPVKVRLSFAEVAG